METTLEKATREGILSTRAAAQMLDAVARGALSREDCEAVLKKRLLSSTTETSDSSLRRRRRQQQLNASAAGVNTNGNGRAIPGDRAIALSTKAAESQHIMPDDDAVVRECMRMLCVELEQNTEAHYCSASPTSEARPQIYTRQPGKLQCRWGEMCRQTGRRHWMTQDHPPGHELLHTRTEMPPWTLSSVPVCRHLQRTGRCFYRDQCRFAHLELSTVTPAAAWDLGTSDAIEITQTVRSGRDRALARQRAPRASRGKACALFRRFLLDTFGLERLQGGGGVLDVAGGAGSLSFELLNLNQVPCVIVDPRRPCFRRASQVVTHRRRQWAASADHSMLSRYDNRQESTTANLDGALSAPRWLEAWFGPWLYCDDSPSTHIAIACPEPAESSDRESEPEPPQQIDGVEELNDELRTGALPNRAVTSACSAGKRDLAAVRVHESEITTVLSRASVVVGLHPDGATDAIVDYALQANKPFAVVPCCIFSKQFSKRRTAAGQRVKTYTDYIEWLQNKHPDIMQHSLGFAGRNVVLYHLGKEASR